MSTTSPSSASPASPRSLGDYKGSVLLVVNVASKCGLTKQYEGLEKLYEARHPQGLEVLGFPANNFKGQEPGSDAEIQQFCQLTYDVKFPMFSKISVKGSRPASAVRRADQRAARGHRRGPFRERLKGFGVDGGTPDEILWNFEKFLVNRQGEVVARFAPDVTATDPRAAGGRRCGAGEALSAAAHRMCGRYLLMQPERGDAAADLRGGLPPWWKVRYNVTPSQEVPTVRLVAGQRAVELMRWGLIPHFRARQPRAVQHHQCTHGNAARKRVRIAVHGARGSAASSLPSAFYEWQVAGDAQAAALHRLCGPGDVRLRRLVGQFTPPDGAPILSCTILTHAGIAADGADPQHQAARTGHPAARGSRHLARGHAGAGMGLREAVSG